jgi:hypothetical protein
MGHKTYAKENEPNYIGKKGAEKKGRKESVSQIGEKCH